MTFTDKPPTEPGFYAWKAQPEDGYFLCRVAMWGDVLCFFHNSGSGPERGPVSVIGGLWCRLVPAEEVEKAYQEGRASLKFYPSYQECWNESRAKRVAEGKEP